MVFLILISGCAANSQSEPDLGYQGKNGDVFGYGTVSNAISSLAAIPGAEKRVVREWTVISIRSQGEIWSFPPESHAAYPSAVKRKVFEKNGGIYLDTKVNCAASRSSCDNLVKDFVELNK